MKAGSEFGKGNKQSFAPEQQQQPGRSSSVSLCLWCCFFKKMCNENTKSAKTLLSSLGSKDFAVKGPSPKGSKIPSGDFARLDPEPLHLPLRSIITTFEDCTAFEKAMEGTIDEQAMEKLVKELLGK